jgi:hypothetical protein
LDSLQGNLGLGQGRIRGIGFGQIGKGHERSKRTACQGCAMATVTTADQEGLYVAGQADARTPTLAT